MDLRDVISVTQLNSYIRNLFWQDEFLRQVFVQGEIANLRDYQGHLYFTLKDEKSSIRAVMWRSNRTRMSFVPKEGMQVIVAGNVSVYERDGVYQVYATYMEPAGLGALYAQLEELKRKLEKEGLFAAERKRPLPMFPRKIGVVTSIRGAAIKDIVSVGRRRYPGVRFVVADSKVQGEGAEVEIAAGIKLLNHIPDVDVIIVGRGGGSQEDLFVFNHELVARAIYASRVPVVSAVGHERDVTIADLVADVRAATPSAAAELVVPNARELLTRVERLVQRGYAGLAIEIRNSRTRLQGLSSRPCLQRPDWFLVSARETLLRLRERLENAMDFIGSTKDLVSELTQSLRRSMEASLEANGRKFGSLALKLDALSPLAVLSRGYSVTRKVSDMTIIRSHTDVNRGDQVLVNLYRGSLVCRVEQTADEEVPSSK
ncbi:MAG: exodeoxyribonuclease VII large subunit [Bacillota bacterium]